MYVRQRTKPLGEMKMGLSAAFMALTLWIVFVRIRFPSVVVKEVVVIPGQEMAGGKVTLGFREQKICVRPFIDRLAVARNAGLRDSGN
jgi:hypothetical protein